MGWTAFQIACVAVFAAISLWIDPRDLNVLAGGLIIGIVVAFFVTGFVVHSQNLICRVRLWRARRRTVSQDGVHQSLSRDPTDGSGFTRLAEPVDGRRGSIENRSRQIL